MKRYNWGGRQCAVCQETNQPTVHKKRDRMNDAEGRLGLARLQSLCRATTGIDCIQLYLAGDEPKKILDLASICSVQ